MEIDYPLLVQRIGPFLGISANSMHLKPDGTGVLAAGNDHVACRLMPSPYPLDVSRLTAFAHRWSTAEADIVSAKAHVVAMSSWSQYSRLDMHVRHLVLVRELVEQLPVIGVLWGNVLTPTDSLKFEFQRMSSGQIPILLWVLIQFTRQPNGNALISTSGMCEFGLMEIETESSLPMQETYGFVRDLAAHMVGNGQSIPDGDTVGLNDTQRVKVRHTRSFRPDVNEQVIWLELSQTPSVKKPEGFFSDLFGSAAKH